MLTRADLYPYQQRTVTHVKDNKEAFLMLDVGLGKTITTLTAVSDMMDTCEVFGTLVLAPLMVVKAVWEQEARKWEHTKDLRFSVIHGTPLARTKALRENADIYLLNYEGLPWFVDRMKRVYLSKGKSLPFNMIVYDESTKVKNSTSKRVRALCKLLPYTDRRVALTGTPAPNGLLDLFGQFLCLDLGKRFGTGISYFKKQYFISDYMGYNWSPMKGARAAIHKKVADITIQLKKEDYLDLPPVMIQDLVLPMNGKARKTYDILEKEYFVELDGGAEIEVFNAAALSNKCLQASNGACYTDEDGSWSELHDLKIDALKDIQEEAGAEPLLVAYNFRHDLARLRKAFPEAVHIKDGDTAEIIERWNRGEIKMLLGHPASCGHGLNLQHGGHHLVMFGLTWNLELYEQVIGRLDRPGQTKPVIVTRIMIDETIEQAVALALDNKAETQDALRAAIKEYRR